MPRDMAAEAVKSLSVKNYDTATAEALNEFLQSASSIAFLVPREYLPRQAAYLQLGTPGAEAALVEYLWRPETGARVPYGDC